MFKSPVAAALQVVQHDGRTFHSLTPSFKHILDVEVGSGGTVFVLDGRTISMEFARGQLRKVPVPSYDEEYGEDEFTALAVGAGYLFHVSRAGLALTRDYGATWRIKELPGGPDVVGLTVEDDASLLAVLTFYNCHSGDYAEVYRGSVDGEWEEVAAHDGWNPYDVSDDRMTPATIVDNGPREFARVGRKLYRLAHDKRVLLSGSVPEGFELLSADACNRVLGLSNERLLRWSPSTGWRQLDVLSD